jgi:hypothetical protein
VNYPGTNDGVSIVGGHEEAWVSLQNNPSAGNYPTQPLWDNAIGGCAQSRGRLPRPPCLLRQIDCALEPQAFDEWRIVRNDHQRAAI